MLDDGRLAAEDAAVDAATEAKERDVALRAPLLAELLACGAGFFASLRGLRLRPFQSGWGNTKPAGRSFDIPAAYSRRPSSLKDENSPRRCCMYAALVAFPMPVGRGFLTK